MEDENAERPVTSHSCFFALLDILGFKNIVKQSTYEQLKGIVESFTVNCIEAIDVSRSIVSNSGNVTSRLRLGDGITVRIVSDSIYVWTKNDGGCLREFDDLLHIVNALLVRGFKVGLPLRGVVTFGELFSDTVKTPADIPQDFSFDNGSLYGKALVEAHELESQMDWSGAIMTPRAWAKVLGEFEKWKGPHGKRVMRSVNIACPEELFNHFPYLVWYDVPFKDRRRNAVAFNWYYPLRDRDAFSAETIQKAFVGHGGVSDDTVKTKIHETIQFYKYSQHIAELCDWGLKKSLPTPDSNYVFSNLCRN